MGFRPFIYRLATEMQLAGWIINSSQGVFIEVEGHLPLLETFLQRIQQEKPAISQITSIKTSQLETVGYTSFEIRQSDGKGAKTTLVLPDIATCPDCLQDIFNPDNRRYLYPFTNCTNCGPRYSIIESLPYDRPGTTMRDFIMCAECRAEYENPLDRRFHAQPNACPTCGPHIELWDNAGNTLETHHSALLSTVDAIEQGRIIAVKGLGGFHLIVDANNESAVQLLRERKKRQDKPLALMFPSLDAIKNVCHVSELEEQLLSSPQAPIVLLRRKSSTGIAPNIAPGNPYLGVMLPYTPLHHILLRELGFPIVATSGNLSDEPICTDEHEAIERLAGIADLFLVHNRPITRHVDDSIVRVMNRREMMLRRARGYAPLPIQVTDRLPTILAVGAHLKNTIAASVENCVFVGQHIGDLETVQAFEAFKQTIDSFQQLYELSPTIIASDAHPDYLSTQYASAYVASSGLPQVKVQHHYAHVLSCIAENQIEAPVLGVAWDGTGYGLDRTVWGGEFLQINETSFERIAHFRTFRLPGGEKAVKEPRRSAVGLLYEIFGDDLFDMDSLIPLETFTKREKLTLQTMLHKGLNSPLTSSAGRIFDACAAILGIRQFAGYEGQAAMELEFASYDIHTDVPYPFIVQENGIIDWRTIILALLEDNNNHVPNGEISAKLHNTFAEIIVNMARQSNETKIVLTGGCFQNKILTERTIKRLSAEGFEPYWHHHIPPNDGGIALGQIMATKRNKS